MVTQFTSYVNTFLKFIFISIMAQNRIDVFLMCPISAPPHKGHQGRSHEVPAPRTLGSCTPMSPHVLRPPRLLRTVCIPRHLHYPLAYSPSLLPSSVRHGGAKFFEYSGTNVSRYDFCSFRARGCDGRAALVLTWTGLFHLFTVSCCAS